MGAMAAAIMAAGGDDDKDKERSWLTSILQARTLFL